MDGSGKCGSAPLASAPGVSGALSVDPEGGSVVPSGNSGAHRIEDRDCSLQEGRGANGLLRGTSCAPTSWLNMACRDVLQSTNVEWVIDASIRIECIRSR